MTLYNPNENHFVVGRMLVEFPLSGGAISSWDIDVIPLRRYMTSENSNLLLLELFVIFFAMIHTYSEWIQFSEASKNRWEYWTSFYNILDVTIVVLGPVALLLQLASLINAWLIDWQSRDQYVNVERQIWFSSTQTQCYSVMVFAACFKLFDYLSVFRTLHRLIVMIEMMVKQLGSFVVVLTLFLITFTVSEYIAYGYKDENSYSIQAGLLARVFGLFSGDPVTFGHTGSDQLLGTVYVIIFLISATMVLMNLIVAVLTSAYDQARNQSSDVLAQRQYEKMNSIGLTKRRPITYLDENGRTLKVLYITDADEHFTPLDHFDIKFVNLCTKFWDKLENMIDQMSANWNKIQKKPELLHAKTIIVKNEDKNKFEDKKTV